MSKNKSFKIILMIILILIIISTVLCIYLLTDKVNETKPAIPEPLSKTQYKPSSEPKPDEFTGMVIQYYADTENATDTEMETAICMLETRLINLGYTEATVTKIDDSQIIEVKIPNEEPGIITEKLGTPGKLTFRNSDGETLMEGTKEYIKDASAQYDVSQGNYVQIEFTEEGREAFKNATSSVLGEQLYIFIDEEVQSAPTVHDIIDSDSCIIQGEFTEEEAEWLVNSIKEGHMPFSLKLVSSSYVTK